MYKTIGRVKVVEVVEIVKERLARVRVLECVVELRVVWVRIGRGVVARHDDGDGYDNGNNDGGTNSGERPDFFTPCRRLPPWSLFQFVKSLAHFGWRSEDDKLLG